MTREQKLATLHALRAEIRTLTVEPPQGPDMERARQKAERARKWNKGRNVREAQS